MGWTKQQQNAIDARNTSLIVSAAAGSGKTAVLTERLAKLIADEASGVRADRIVVVTFTNDAASELKKRLDMKLRELLNEHPDDRHLLKQQILLQSARISTINSFCFDLIRDNMSESGVTSAFGVLDDTDNKVLRARAMDELINFEGLKTVAEDIHARASELGFDAFSASDMDASSSWRFTGHMANLEYFYEERDDGGWTECPATLKGTYMDNYRLLYDLCINNSTVKPESLATGGHDPENEFKTGKAVFFVNGSWEYENVAKDVPSAVMIPYYCGVAGEEKAGLNCGTENYWAINSLASEADRKATMDFLVWCVTDAEASRMLVDTFGVMPFKNSAESRNGFLANANRYANEGCYIMDWATSYQPNVDNYRTGLVSALNEYNADRSDSNWAKVETAFIQGWTQNYKAANE